MYRILRAILPVLILLTAIPVTAEHMIQQINTPANDCDGPVIATSPDGHALVAWVEEGSGMFDIDIVWSRLVPSYMGDDDTLPDPVSHGPGGLVDVCWSHEGYTLAMASGDAVVLYQSDYLGNFDLGEFEVLTPYPDGFGIRTIDLWGSASHGAGPHVFMTVGGTLYIPDSSHSVLHANRTESGWSTFEVIADGLISPGWPQVSWEIGPAGPLPMVYYVDDYPAGHSVVYTTRRIETGWDEPVPVPCAGGMNPCPVAGLFDVSRANLDQIAILGLGMQPTCPCGTIHSIGRETNGIWTDPENLTVEYTIDMNWPMSPHVQIATDGRVHAFWFQQGSGPMLDPRLWTLEYWIGDDGDWTDEGEFLDAQEIAGLGSRVAMALTPEDEALFAWSLKDTIDGEPQPRAIWIARPWSVSDVPEGRSPDLQFMLDAHPNPFNPLTSLRYWLSRDASVELAIYDVTGRLVRRLDAGERVAGSHTVSWDGRDGRGRAMTSGLYLGRIRAEGVARTVKLMLLR